MIQSKRTEKRRKGRGRAAAVLTTALLVSAFMMQTVHAGWADTDCKVKVNPPDTTKEEFAELADTEVALDVYRIAAAYPQAGADAYELVWDAAYEKQEEMWAKALEKESGPDASDVEALAQGLAETVLKNVPEYKSTDEGKAADPYTKAALGDTVTLKNDTDNGAGMYLIIAHGVNDKDYKKTDEETETLGTIARGKTKLFVFNPMLVTVPVRGEAHLAESGDIRSTADTGEWQHEVNIDCKVSVREEEKGSLVILKTLEAHEQVGDRYEPATFVFEVTGYKSEEAFKNNDPDSVIYSDVVTMVFDSPGSQTSEEITDLPAGAYMVVKEAYAGGNYAGRAIKDTATITAEEVAQTEFTNSYNETWNGGGSVRNHFAADEQGWLNNKDGVIVNTKDYADNSGIRKNNDLFQNDIAG